MKPKIKWAVGLVLALTYLAFFVRIPQIDYPNSAYIIQCSSTGYYGSGLFAVQGRTSVQAHPLGGIAWELIPGRYLYFTQEPGARFLTPHYKSKNADVIAKFICSGSGELGPDHLPIDAQEYAQRVIHSPDFEKAAIAPANYGFVRWEVAYTPSWGEEIGKLMILALLLLALAYWPRRLK